MTGWIKIRDDLHEDATVLELSDICRTSELHVVGMLARFWAWAGRQSTDGRIPGISDERIDRLVDFPGFAAAMRRVGWLAGEDGNAYIPSFERHNSDGAKARALEAEAKRIRRMGASQESPDTGSDGDPKTSDKTPPSVSDTCPTKRAVNVGPEKRREEKKSTHTPTPQAGGREDVSGSLPRTGFPAKQAALDYAEAQGWPIRSALSWWLDRDGKGSAGEPRFRDPNWHWWSDLERWVMTDARTGGQPGGGATVRRTPAAKPTINDYDRPDTWTADQISLDPSTTKA